MDSWDGVYYGLCAGLWVVLAALGGASLWPGFAGWLEQRPRMTLLLLGINRLPAEPARTLRRFYLFLSGGWTWLLVWSWWLMPWLKNHFYHNLTTLKNYHIARVSVLVLLVAYSAFGFFCVGKAIKIWFQEIYNRP